MNSSPTRLWQYLSIYFLKPFDAVNDVATSRLLLSIGLPNNYLALAPGDGIFSCVMHGGRMPLSFDRYLQTDLSAVDIFDTHTSGQLIKPQKPPQISLPLAIDTKISHLYKTMEINLSKTGVHANYENLPLSSESQDAIFMYTPHGLKNLQEATNEIYRVLKPNGALYVLVYNQVFRSSFLCHRFSQSSATLLATLFKRLDNGRYEELSQISLLPDQWEQFFEIAGFNISKRSAGLSTVAWKFYDIQTRPFLRLLIKLFSVLPRNIRTATKFLWMIVWYPILLVFYFLFASSYISRPERSCYLAFKLTKASDTPEKQEITVIGKSSRDLYGANLAGFQDYVDGFS